LREIHNLSSVGSGISWRHNWHQGHLSTPKFSRANYPATIHPAHEREVCANSGKPLALSVMIIGKVREHLIPSLALTVPATPNEVLFAQKARSSIRRRLSAKVGEYVCLPLPDIGECLGAVEDLKRADQVCVGLVKVWGHKDTIM